MKEEISTMTNGTKRDRSISKSTISTPPHTEVQHRRKGDSNDTTNAKIDGHVTMSLLRKVIKLFGVHSMRVSVSGSRSVAKKAHCVTATGEHAR